MLRNDFYSITSIQSDAAVVNAIIRLNAAHRVFDGHFPGQPVVPGVCMMQMVKEVFEEVLKSKMILLNAASIKFLSVIDPRKTPEVTIVIKYRRDENAAIVADAQFNSGDTVVFKMKAEFSSVKGQSGN